jgi:hypothetical protein
LRETKGTIKNRSAGDVSQSEMSAVEAGIKERDRDVLTKPFKIWKRIGYTIYEVEARFNLRSRETLDDKIMRLVRRDATKDSGKIS